MSTPQPGIFAEFGTFHHALEYKCAPSQDPAATRKAIAAARSIAVGKDAAITFAFGPKLWTALAGEPLEGLHPFETISSHAGTATSTQGDLFVWVKANRHNDAFDLAVAVHETLSPVFDCTLDLPGFDYRESHDLIGFEDGTANPKGDDRMEAAVVPDGEAGAGGSFVLTQKWVHDLPKFEAVPVPEQEGIVGRTKADSIELEGDAMPEDSHVSRTDVSVDGVTQKLWRRSFPYGTVSEKGLYFLAFAKSIFRFQIQLDRMYGRTEDGIHDRLIEFSEAATSSYWFAPSVEDLDRITS